MRMPAIALCAVLLTAVGAEASSPDLAFSSSAFPLYFEPNLGQADPRVRFIARGAGYALFITDQGLTAVLGTSSRCRPPRGTRREACPSRQASVVTMTLVGAPEGGLARGVDRLPGTSNYFIGNDPERWRTGIPQYGSVRVSDVYRGIDLVYHGGAGELEYDFIVKPGADPRRIALHFDGLDDLEVEERGDLVMHTGGRELRHRAPTVYQEMNGVRRQLDGGYVRKFGTDVMFRVDHYDPGVPLAIDPVILYSRYLGGSDADEARGVSVAPTYVVVAGTTWSSNFPVTGAALKPAHITTDLDAFVVKLNSSTGVVVYATYLGGPGDDAANSVDIDDRSNAHVAGTAGHQFPITAGAMDSSYGGGGDGFVAKLNAGGTSLTYSTYAGGGGTDEAFGIALDFARNAYVTGQTESLDFPHTLGQAFAGTHDAFVMKLDSNGALAQATFLGAGAGQVGGAETIGNAIAVAGSVVYVVGNTNSTIFPTTSNAMQRSAPDTASQYAFLAGYDSNLNRFYSTYFVGAGDTSANAAAADVWGYVYFGGAATYSVPFRTGTYEGQRGYVAKWMPGLMQPAFSVIAGTDSTMWVAEVVTGLAVDLGGYVHATGETNSSIMTTIGAVQSVRGGGTDAFVTKIRPTGATRVYQTYLGGTLDEQQPKVALDSRGNAYVAGTTFSTNFAVVPPGTSAASGSSDAFLAKLGPNTTVSRPAILHATGAASSVGLSWSNVPSATMYIIEKAASFSDWQYRASSTVNSFSDPIVLQFTAYEYRVRAVTDDGISDSSSTDLATVYVTQDDPALARSTLIRASHLNDLRRAADAIRLFARMPAASYSSAIAPGSRVRASDFIETQTALNAGLAALGYPQPTRPIAVGGVILAADLNELRSRTR